MQNGFALVLLLLSQLVYAQTDVTEPAPEVETEVNLNQQKLDGIQNLTRVAFGSCNYQHSAQPLWKDMLTTKPDIFIWAGDIIYADWEDKYDIKKSFAVQKNHSEYARVRAQTAILGTWDDHDYSWNDENGNAQNKKENQQIFLDFLDEPRNSQRRKQEGIYTSYNFGQSERQVKVILLDNRYFKDLEAGAPILGEKQWQWLEEEFKSSKAKVHLVTTGLSIFSPLIPYSEEWWHYPSEVNRLLGLVRKYKPQGLVFLTGDKHFGTIFKSYGQLEMISSGMTHVVSRKAWWYLARKYPVTWFGLNYGMIDIEWEGSNPLITLAFRNIYGENVHRQRYRWENENWERIWQ